MDADAMPVYDMLEYQMVKRNIPNGWISRLIYRTIYVVIVAFIAITIPFFGSLLVSKHSSRDDATSCFVRVEVYPTRKPKRLSSPNGKGMKEESFHFL